MSTNLLTQERLREVLEYSPETGVFVWKVKISCRTKVKEIAGYLNNQGYVSISIDKKLYLAHRLAFLYMEGYFPEQQIDHLDNIRNNNRWDNLRHVSQSCNLQNCRLQTNSTSGFIGVSWHKYAEKWVAYIKIYGKTIHIGIYNTPEKAAMARCNYEDKCPDWTCDYLAVNRVKLRSMGYKI
jgi:hypothetical protein